MPARRRMTMRAAVERDTPAGTDDFGSRGVPSWGAHIASQPCYYYARAETEIIDGEKQIVLGTHRILMPLGTDITEYDRITSITDRLGANIVGNTMRINSVIRRTGHMVLTVTEVK